jgi:hypothetical protein
MAAITPTKIYEITGGASNLLYGTAAPDNEKVIVIEATTTATSNTIDVSTYVPACTGIKRRNALCIDEAIVATADTFSGTTITFASHTGSGRYVGVFVIKTN